MVTTALNTVLPLRGGYQGQYATTAMYWVELGVGDSQTFKVQLDTGSSDLVLISERTSTLGIANSTYEMSFCEKGSESTPLYNPDLTGTATPAAVNGSGFWVAPKYGGDALSDMFTSATGLAYWDDVSLGMFSVTGASVGALFGFTEEYGRNGISGVLGLAYKDISRMYTLFGESPVFDLIVDASEGAVNDQFGLCLSADGESDGKMILGAGETPGMKYAPYDPKVAGRYDVPGCVLQVGDDANAIFKCRRGSARAVRRRPDPRYPVLPWRELDLLGQRGPGERQHPPHEVPYPHLHPRGFGHHLLPARAVPRLCPY